jgi:peptidoglycan hydrolase-like protein with peptidoglycan-binding domain
MRSSTKGNFRQRLILVAPVVMALVAWGPVAQAGQNRRGPRSQEATAPAPPPATATIHLSPAAVRQVQLALTAAGFKPDRTDGVWDAAGAKAVMQFQAKKNLDPSGHLDLMTIVAIGLPQLLDGEPPAAGGPWSKEAVAGGGAPLYMSPATVRKIQLALEQKAIAAKSTNIPGNILGVWHAGSEKSAKEFQKAHGLAPLGVADLELVHALQLDAILNRPAADNVLMLTSEQAPFGGVEVQLGPDLITVVQQALEKHGMKAGATPGRWTPETVEAVRTFQQSQKLAPTGNLDLETLRALGFTHPLADLVQARPQS